MIRVLVMTIALAGCAWVARSKTTKLSRQVAAYEKLSPDAEALGRGDPATTTHTLREIADWSFHIGQQDVSPVDRQHLIDRLEAARRRYLLAAAKLANTPDLGYALAQMALAPGDTEALAIVRALGDARAERRQTLFASSKTYAIEDGTDAVGNCVFATRPFGDDTTPNPALTFRLIGRTAFYARCYLERDPSGLPASDASWVIGVGDGGAAVKILPVRSSRFRDFLVTPTRDLGKHYAHLQVDLNYDYSDGLVLVWERNTQVLKKRMRTIKLAGSPVFWERGDDQR
jgi:hypothetical protein